MSPTVFTEKNFVADFLQAKYDFTSKTAGGLGATYDDYLRLIEKRVVEFILVLI